VRRAAIAGCVLLVLSLSPGDVLAKGKPPQAGKPEHAGGPPGKAGKAGPEKGPHHGPPPVLREVTYRSGGPPPWAPAHGYRRKHGGGDERYVMPYRIAEGTCDRDAVAATLGAAGGGLIASSVSDDPRAIIGGMLAGALLATALSRTADPVDRGCFGQALEHAPSHQRIAWRSPKDGAAYQFTPLRSFQLDDGRYCREYTTVVARDGSAHTDRGTACRTADGSWRSY
jgi:surface antigen